MKPYGVAATIGGASAATLGGLPPMKGVIRGVRANQWTIGVRVVVQKIGGRRKEGFILIKTMLF